MMIFIFVLSIKYPVLLSRVKAMRLFFSQSVNYIDEGSLVKFEVHLFANVVKSFLSL